MSYAFGEKEEVLKNRKDFFKKIKLPLERVVALEVMHGTKIIEATIGLAGAGIFSSETAIRADAIVTKEKNLGLFLLTADCVPAVFYDPQNSVVCLAHISRKNMQLGFAQTIVSYLHKNHGVAPSSLRVYFGPSIQKESYIIPEFSNGFDLVGETITQLTFKGVPKDNIFTDGKDTAVSDEFFSHYRDVRNKTPEGRFASVVMLV